MAQKQQILMSPVIKGSFFAVLGFSLFSFCDVIGKFLGQDYSVFQIVFFNGLFGFLLMGLLDYRKRRQKAFTTKSPKWHIIRGILNGALTILAFSALQYLPLANFYAIMFAAPIVIKILSWGFLKENVSKHIWAASIIGFLGVLTVVRPTFDGLGAGEIYCLLGMVCLSIVLLIPRHVGEGESGLFWGMTSSFGSMVIASPVAIMNWDMPEGIFLWSLFILCGVFVGLGIAVQATAFRLAGAAASPYHYCQILWGVLFGYLIWDDIPDFYAIIGLVLIISSGLYIVRYQRQKAA